MSVTLQQEGDMEVMRVCGVVEKAELDAAQAAAAARWNQDDNVKLLVIIDAFKGWGRSDDWGDMTNYIENRERITKIAIVGDPTLEDEMMMFTGAGFRPAPVRYFPPEQLDRARQWLAL